MLREISMDLERSERHEFRSRFLCVVGKQRRTENAGMGLTTMNNISLNKLINVLLLFIC